MAWRFQFTGTRCSVFLTDDSSVVFKKKAHWNYFNNLWDSVLLLSLVSNRRRFRVTAAFWPLITRRPLKPHLAFPRKRKRLKEYFPVYFPFGKQCLSFMPPWVLKFPRLVSFSSSALLNIPFGAEKGKERMGDNSRPQKEGRQGWEKTILDT